MHRFYIKMIAIVAICMIMVGALAFFLGGFRSLHLLRVQGKGMEPTLHEGDRILVTKRFDQLRRGDIVIFRYPPDPSKSFIKRVVGLPGELIEISDGKVIVNGQGLRENYLDSQLNRFPYKGTPTRIPEGKYYVMGGQSRQLKRLSILGTIVEGAYSEQSRLSLLTRLVSHKVLQKVPLYFTNLTQEFRIWHVILKRRTS